MLKGIIMATLTETEPTTQVSGGDYHIRAVLNGGTASLEHTPLDFSSASTVKDPMVDGEIEIYFLAEGSITAILTGGAIVEYKSYPMAV
jgi:hypothetical protein